MLFLRILDQGCFIDKPLALVWHVLGGFLDVVDCGRGARGDIRTLVVRSGRRHRLRELNLQLEVVLRLLYLKVGHGFALNWNLRLNTLLLTELLILDVELVITDAVHGLLGGFSEENAVEQVLQHEVDGLVSGFLSLLELLAVHFDLGPRFDFLLFLLLAEGRTDVRLVVVGRLPEHAHERVPVLLRPPLLPVVDHLLLAADFRQLLVDLRVAVLLQQMRHLLGLLRLVDEGTLLEGVDHALQLLLSEAHGRVGLQKFAVALSHLVVLRAVVEQQVVVSDRGHILHEVVSLGQLLHGFVGQLNFHYRHGRRQLILFLLGSQWGRQALILCLGGGGRGLRLLLGSEGDGQVGALVVNQTFNVLLETALLETITPTQQERQWVRKAVARLTLFGPLLLW